MTLSILRKRDWIQAWCIKKAFALSNTQLRSMLDRVTLEFPLEWRTILLANSELYKLTLDKKCNATFNEKFNVWKEAMVLSIIRELDIHGQTKILNRSTVLIQRLFEIAGNKRQSSYRSGLADSINALHLRKTYEDKNDIEKFNNEPMYISLPFIEDRKQYVLEKFQIFDGILFDSIFINKKEIVTLLSTLGLPLRKNATGITQYVIDDITASSNLNDFKHLFTPHIPDTIIEEYEAEMKKESKGKRNQLKAYLLSMQGFDKHTIAERLGSSMLSANISANIRKYIRSGKKLADEKGLTDLSKYGQWETPLNQK